MIVRSIRLVTLLLLSEVLVLASNDDSPTKVKTTSTKVEIIEGEPYFYVAPIPVEAGSYPRTGGNVLAPLTDQYPALKNYVGAEFETAFRLSENEGMGQRLSAFLPGSYEPINRLPIAAIEQDLKDAGYSGNSSDVRAGMLDIFRVELELPGFDSIFPAESILHLEFEKGKTSRILEWKMSSSENGIYTISDISDAMQDLVTIYEEFGARSGFNDSPTEMRILKMTGFEFNSESIDGLPPIVGTPLIHHVYLGSYRLISGWQWAGRPIGLYGSQQPGFVQE